MKCVTFKILKVENRACILIKDRRIYIFSLKYLTLETILKYPKMVFFFSFVYTAVLDTICNTIPIKVEQLESDKTLAHLRELELRLFVLYCVALQLGK